MQYTYSKQNMFLSKIILPLHLDTKYDPNNVIDTFEKRAARIKKYFIAKCTGLRLKYVITANRVILVF